LHFNISALSSDPYLTVEKDSKGQWQFRGMFPTVFFIIQNMLNFTYTLSTPPDKQWGSKVRPCG
jgi:hypothetical protein